MNGVQRRQLLIAAGALLGTALGAQGQQAAKVARIGYLSPNLASSPGLLTPSAAYTFGWTGYLCGGNEGNRIKRYRWEIIAGDIVEIEMSFDIKLIATELGYFFKDATA